MQLAQVNVAQLRAPLDSTELQSFVAVFDPVGRLADASPGLLWRMVGSHRLPVVQEGGFVTVSVWQDYPSLHAFVYRSAHGGLLARRATWFLPPEGPTTALWWVPDGTRPSVEKARARLEHLRAHGPSPQAFDQRRRFDASGRAVRR
jgi:hypothetical protein